MNTNRPESRISDDGFQKSSYSMNGSNCVEYRPTAAGADMRDTQNRDAGHLTFPASSWAAIVATARQDLR